MRGAQFQSLVGELSSHVPQWPEENPANSGLYLYLGPGRTEAGGPEAQKRCSVQVPPHGGSSCSELADRLWVGLSTGLQDFLGLKISLKSHFQL